MVKVIVDKEFGLDAALREFKKKVNKAGILYECRKREYFMTPIELAEFKRKNRFMHPDVVILLDGRERKTV